MPMITTNEIIFAVGRALFSATFLISAVRHSLALDTGLDEMAKSGFPRSYLLLSGSILLRVAGGLAVLLGFHAQLGGVLLVIFILPATFVAHGFWTKPPSQRTHDLIEFLNNLAMTGGALFVIASGSGTLSVDQLLFSH